MLKDKLLKYADENKIVKIAAWNCAILVILMILYVVLYHSPMSPFLYQFLPAGGAIKKSVPIILIVLLCVDLRVLFSEWFLDNKTVVYGIILITFFTSLPLMNRGIVFEQDLGCHMVRFQSVTDAVKTGQFPVRMNSGYFYGYGYPISVYYGDLFTYIITFFELAGYQLYQAYKFFVVIINLLTAAIAYYCFKGMSKDKRIGMLCSFAYTAAPYRLTWIYIVQFTGMFPAVTFIPLIAYATYRIYTEDIGDVRARNKIAFMLSIGISGCIGTHILTSIITIIALVIVAIIMFKKTFTKNVIYTFLIAAIETVLISAWFVIPFLDYYVSIPTVVSNTVSGGVRHIQNGGLIIPQLLGFNINAYGANTQDINGIDFRYRNMSLGIVMISGILSYIYMAIKKKVNKMSQLAFVLGIVFISATTCYFPWDYLADKVFIFRFLSQIQFPWRILSVATVFVVIILSQVLSYAKEIYDDNNGKASVYNLIIAIGILACVFECCSFSSSYLDGGLIFYFKDSTNTEMEEILGGQYLRYGSDVHNLSHSIDWAPEIDDVNDLGQNGCNYLLSCVNTSSDDSWVEVPIFNYKGYYAVDSQGNKLKISDGSNNVIRVTIPGGYAGNVMVDFKEPVYWRIAELVTLISFVLLLIVNIRSKKYVGNKTS